MQVTDFCYPLKSALLLFLEQIYLDTEKSIGEDFINQVWQVISLLENDLLKFVEVMQRQKRQSNVLHRKTAPIGSDMSMTDMISQQHVVHQIQVDVAKNFDFVTNFGRFKISALMQDYVFESIFPCLKEFLNLRLPMKSE